MRVEELGVGKRRAHRKSATVSKVEGLGLGGEVSEVGV